MVDNVLYTTLVFWKTELFDAWYRKCCFKHLVNTTKIERLKTGYQPIPFQAGRKMAIGFIEGLEQLSFGDKAIIFIPSVWDMGCR
jgi:hypothetical protein